MNLKQTLLITGYRSFELSIFRENDPKIAVIKKVLTQRLIEKIEDGLEWVIVGGNLGVELWAAEVVLDLKETYPDVQLALILPYVDFGEKWSENNRESLQNIEFGADYVNHVSQQAYQNPSQLKNHTKFLLTHTDSALFVYDEEYPGKTQYVFKDAQEIPDYTWEQITVDDLQNSLFDDEFH